MHKKSTVNHQKLKTVHYLQDRPWLVPERSRASCPEGVALVPVVYGIKFKLALVMFMIHTHQCPDYLTDSVHPYSNNDPARYRLRSATGTNYSVPRTRTKFVDRAFSVAGPVVWNSLPAAVRHADSLHSFKRRLKSHFFSLCFND